MKYDKLLPEYTGAVGFVAANTFVALGQYAPGPYPMDAVRVNLLLYGAAVRMRRQHQKALFYEPFVALTLDDMLIPVLPTVMALYGDEPPRLIAGPDGNAVVILTTESNMAGDIIKALYEETFRMSNRQLFEHLRNKTLSGLIRGQFIHI